MASASPSAGRRACYLLAEGGKGGHGEERLAKGGFSVGIGPDGAGLSIGTRGGDEVLRDARAPGGGYAGGGDKDRRRGVKEYGDKVKVFGRNSPLPLRGIPPLRGGQW